MIQKFPLFSSLVAPQLGTNRPRFGNRMRLPFLIEPGRPRGQAVSAAAQARPTPASGSVPITPKPPTGAYPIKPETHGEIVSAVARNKDAASTVSHGEVVSNIAKGAAPLTADATQAELDEDAKKRRRQAARIGILRNQATNKPPVLSAPGTSSASLPATAPNATVAAMASNKLI